MQVLNQDIKNREFKQVYLLFGDEPYLISNYKKKLREAIAGDDTMNFNYFEGIKNKRGLNYVCCNFS